PPDQTHQFVEEQEKTERAQNVIKVVAVIETPDRYDLDRHSKQQGGDERQNDAAGKTAGERGECRGEICAHHVKRAVRKIDEVHDAEDQRQTSREQEQQQSELQ